MAYDKQAYDAWRKQFPEATEEEQEQVKRMYAIPDPKKAREEEAAKVPGVKA